MGITLCIAAGQTTAPGFKLAAMNGMSEQKPMRVFFALWPGAAECARLAAWQAPLQRVCGGRAMRAETLHATLVFLGNVAGHRFEALALAAQEAAGVRFVMRLDEARYWRHNHIVYAAPLQEPEGLARLVRQLEQGLCRHHFHIEPRSYQPHVTLLRRARWDERPLPELPAVTWPVHDFALVQSLSDEHGARYRVLARFPLAAAARTGLP